MTSFQGVEPATGRLRSRWALHDEAQIERRLARAHQAVQAWAGASVERRAALLLAIADRLEAHRDDLAEQIAREMGKPVSEGRGEVEKCAWVCRYFAEQGTGWLAPEPIQTDAHHSYVRREPFGLLLGIMPWNFPFWQVFRFAAPALLAGNGMLIKHAAITTGCGERLEQIADEAGLPQGVLSAIVVDHDAVEPIIADKRVAAVTVTGSERAGAAVGEAAGRHLKKCVLELGGSDAFVVLEDADLEAAARTAARSRLQNAGQSCISAKRFIVVESVAAAFIERIRHHMSQVKPGDPLDPDTSMGPLAREDLRGNLHRQVQRSVAAGAKLQLGGEPLKGPGFFYPPTLLTDVSPGMPCWDEETFGPLAAVTSVSDEGGAVRAANDSPYGLGAAVWTGDRARGEAVAGQLEVGTVSVNGMVKSDPRLPFGGVKQSGFGRELSWVGLYEFVNQKSVWVG